MMSESVLTLYLKAYLEELGRGKESFFITITDFERELMQFLNRESFPEYSMAVVDVDDYSCAVALRNDPRVRKIVLFTEDCTRRIDSLKDFQEFPFFPEESKLFWRCVEKACGFKADEERHRFVNLLRREKKILASDLFEYLLLSVKNGNLSAESLNSHLDMFHCFRSTDPSLSIPLLKKKIRNSDAEIIEKQLRPAISDNLLDLPRAKTNKLIHALNEGDYQKVFEILDYVNDKLEEAFKQTFRKKTVVKKDAEEEAVQYHYSYEALLKEEEELSIEELEEDISESFVRQDEDDIFQMLFERAMGSYTVSEAEYKAADSQITELMSMAERMRLGKANEDFLKRELGRLQACWRRMQGGEKERAKPYLLNAYCESQKEFLEAYLGLVKYVVINDSVLEASSGELFYERLQMLFCAERDNAVYMPFYHPVMGFYFMYLREIFRQAIQDMESGNELRKEVVLSMAEKKRSFFPVRFLSYGGDLYEIDCEDAYGKAEIPFRNVGSGIPDYRIEFGMFHKYILNYVKNHPYQPELFVAIVDIGDLKGIEMLFKGLNKVTEAKKYVLNRVTIHIISRNEPEMKRALELYEDSFSNYPSIRFKFSVRQQGEKGEAQLRDIVENTDIVVLADSEYLYERPRLVPYTQSPNSFIAWAETAGVEHFLEQYKEGADRFNILWETMQNASRNANSSLSVWSYREVKQRTFQFFDEAVDKNPELEIIILSSNTGLMRMIYQSEHYGARVDRSKGKDVLVLDYSKDNQRNHFGPDARMGVQLPLGGLLYNIIEEKEMARLLPEQVRNLIDRFALWIELGEEVRFCYGVSADQEKALDEDWAEIKEQVEEMLDSILGYAFLREGILAGQLKEMIVRECYQRADSYGQALGVYHLSQMRLGQWQYVKAAEIGEISDELKDCMESIEFERIMQYLGAAQRIDESSVTRFNRYYNISVLRNIVEADNGLGLLSGEMKSNAVQILSQQ